MTDIKDFFELTGPENEPKELVQLRKKKASERKKYEQQEKEKEDQRRLGVQKHITDLMNQAVAKAAAEDISAQILLLQQVRDLADAERGTISDSDNQYKTLVAEIIEKLEKSISKLERQQQNRILLTVAKQLEQEADYLAASLQKADLSKAFEKYESAGQKFFEAEHVEAKARCNEKQSQIQVALENLEQVKELVEAATQRLHRLEDYQKDGVLEQKQLSHALRIICSLFGQASRSHPQSADVRSGLEETRRIALSLHWTEEQYQAAVNLPNINDESTSEDIDTISETVVVDLVPLKDAVKSINGKLNILLGLIISMVVIVIGFAIMAFIGTRVGWFAPVAKTTPTVTIAVLETSLPSNTDLAVVPTITDTPTPTSTATETPIPQETSVQASTPTLTLTSTSTPSSTPTPTLTLTLTATLKVMWTLAYNSSVWQSPDAGKSENNLNPSAPLPPATNVQIQCKVNGKDQEGHQILFFYVTKIDGSDLVGYIAKNKFSPGDLVGMQQFPDCPPAP